MQKSYNAKLLLQNILKFRTAVISAIKYRKCQNIRLSQKNRIFKNRHIKQPQPYFRGA
jgi:hypothetical protein